MTIITNSASNNLFNTVHIIPRLQNMNLTQEFEIHTFGSCASNQHDFDQFPQFIFRRGNQINISGIIRGKGGIPGNQGVFGLFERGNRRLEDGVTTRTHGRSIAFFDFLEILGLGIEKRIGESAIYRNMAFKP